MLKRIRIAPTPSGFLHIGNALSFMITEALAQKKNADILLRVDNLDRARQKPEYVEDVFQSLQHLGIEYQLGPKNAQELSDEWSQWNRLELYSKAISKH